MKIFIIDKYNNLDKISNELKKIGYENIERKNNCKFKMTKNDFAIISDENDFEGLEKLKNIIVFVKDKNYKHIWKIVTSYKTIDVIDLSMPISYMVKRIQKSIGDNV